MKTEKQKIIENALETGEEIFFKKFPAWFIKAGNTIDETGITDKVLLLKEMDCHKHKLIANEYPMILIDNKTVTEHVEAVNKYAGNQSVSFDYIPPVEFADNKNAYIKCNNQKAIYHE